MKKLMMIAALMLMSIGAFAQEAGKMSVGADLNMAFDSKTMVGAGARAQYSLTENFRAEAKAIYYFEDNTIWNVNLGLQYLIPAADKLYIYPEVGTGIYGWKNSGLSASTALVFFGGAGAEYYITDNIKATADLIYQYGKKDGAAVGDYPLLSIGAAYIF